ncbi:unnamed protein product, partial [Porites lobata]
LFRDSVCVHKIDAGNRTSYEFSEWLIHLTCAEKMRVVVVYRPPYSGEHKVPTNVFFDEFSAYLESLLLFKFRDLLESVGLRQHVKKSTHNNGHILDLIITRFTDSTICIGPQVDRFISDHASVICHVLASRPFKARHCSAREAECFSAMEKCIRAVRGWMIQDKMKLNDDKTDNMTLVPFINNTCKSAFSQLYNIRRIRKYLTTDTS